MKKGFTLIELLAVIVILAIIALIATPIILGIIEDARIGSIEASANGYIDAVEYKIASNEIKNEELKDGIYDVSELDVDIDGEKPTSGTVTVENGDILESTLIIDNKIVYYDGTIAKIAYEDKILNGADPIVKDELVPVNISSNGTVTKANISKEWYNYTNKEWANAVILFDDKNYKVGEEIKEENIKEYYVWIPKYAYKLWNVNSDNTNNVGKPIEIVFGNKAKTTGTNNGDMYLHPAFTNFKTQGIWVGKFELSYNDKQFTDSSTFLTPGLYEYPSVESKKILIKPNIKSLNLQNVKGYFTLLYNSHRNLNSHMMTNMEWGATAYLTYSVYGRCDSELCTEVTNNNITMGYYKTSAATGHQNEWDSTITGCAADNIRDAVITNSDKCINEYNTEKGVLASTTGNITGIYDMSGGASEYVMGAIDDYQGNINLSSSGFTNELEGMEKYYNLYTAGSEWNTYKRGKLGDATREVANHGSTSTAGLWFSDYAMFPNSQSTWFSRGVNWHNGKGSGLFAFNESAGYGNHASTTRAVLAF